MPPPRASGIHDHPFWKTGRRAPKNAPALRLSDFLTGETPAHPVTADHLGSLPFGLYDNDRYGVCGPTSAANLVRLITAALLGSEIVPSQNDVFDLYRRSGNPDFDPNNIDPSTGEAKGDGGVDMQTMCEAWLSGGLGDGKGGRIKPLCFAKVDVSNESEMDAAISIFGGMLLGVNLLRAQQAQTDARLWNYVASSEWGGHAVLDGAYIENGSWRETVISWAMKIAFTDSFERHQVEEAWVLIFQWHLDHPAFQAGVDAQALADAYHAITGKTIPNLPTPQPPPVTPPTPSPAPGGSGNNGPFLVGPFSDHVAARLAELAAHRNWTIEELITYHVKYGSAHWSP